MGVRLFPDGTSRRHGAASADCARLARFLAATPILNKKAGDFEIWHEAVAAWLETTDPRVRDSRMARLIHRLHEHRSYSVQPDYVPVDISPTYLQPYLSGFVTAEGHFGAITESGHPRFAINVRRDDRAFLEFAQRHYGLGEMRLVPERGGSRPAASWRVGRLADIARLAEILNGYPPRGRQGEVYRAWKALVANRVGSRAGSLEPQELLLRRELAGACGSRGSIERPHRSPGPIMPGCGATVASARSMPGAPRPVTAI